MTGKQDPNVEAPKIQELENIKSEDQPDALARHFAQTRNLYEPIKNEDFEDFLGKMFGPPKTFYPTTSNIKCIEKYQPKCGDCKGRCPC